MIPSSITDLTWCDINIWQLLAKNINPHTIVFFLCFHTALRNAVTFMFPQNFQILYYNFYFPVLCKSNCLGSYNSSITKLKKPEDRRRNGIFHIGQWSVTNLRLLQVFWGVDFIVCPSLNLLRRSACCISRSERKN